VKLVHQPSQYIVIASNREQQTWQEKYGDNGSESFCVFLANDASVQDTLSSRWQLCSRFKIRREGDPVRSDDYVILRNMRYRQQVMAPFGRICEIPSESPLSRIVVTHPLTDLLSQRPPYWRVQLISRLNMTIPTALHFGDFVTISSVESTKKFLISRVDDDREIKSILSPIGLSSMRLMDENGDNFEVYIRGAPDDSGLDVGDSLSYALWQILPDEGKSFPFSEVRWNDGIILRHLLSGKLLSFEKTFTNGDEYSGSLTTEYSENCMFTIHSVDVGIDERELVVKKSDSVYFVHNNSETLLILDAEIPALDPLALQNDAGIDNFAPNEVWWEYLYDVPFSSAILDLDSSAVIAALTTLTVTDATIVREVLFVKKMLPIIIKALKKVSQPELSSNDFPIFRHLFNAIVALARWIMGDIDNDYVIDNAASGLEVMTVNSSWQDLSSLSTWIFLDPNIQKREVPSNSMAHASSFRYKKGYVSTKVESSEFNPNSPTAKRRRKILENSRFLDMLLHLVQSVHLTMQAKESNASLSSVSSSTAIPEILIECCVATQELLLVMAVENVAFSARLASLSGSLFKLILQKINGRWDPPVQPVLAAFESLLQQQSSTPSLQVTSLLSLLRNIIDPSDIKEIINYMKSLGQQGDQRAFQAFNILSAISFPGSYPNQQFQELILRSVVNVDQFISSPFGTVSQAYACPSNTLFQTRYNTTPSSNGNSWEVRIAKPGASLHNQEDESSHYHAISDPKVQEELLFLAYSFQEASAPGFDEKASDHVSDVASISHLPRSIARSMLQAQGFILDILESEVNHIQGGDFWEVWRWWYGRRLNYFPSRSRGQTPSAIDTKTFLAEQRIDWLSSASESFIQKIDRSIGKTALETEELYQPMTSDDSFSMNSPLFMSTSSTMALEEKTSPLSISPTRRQTADETCLASPDNASFLRWTKVLMPRSSLNDYDRVWLLKSLTLVVALCRGRNIYSQYFGSAILPMECLIELLEQSSSMKFEVRQLLFDYLAHVFLDHDMVYQPTFAATIDASAGSITLTTEDNSLALNQFFSAGMLFNPRSRYVFTEAMNEDVLCCKLWLVVTRSIDQISLIPANNHEADQHDSFRRYCVSLLHSLKLLVHLRLYWRPLLDYLFPASMGESPGFESEYQELAVKPDASCGAIICGPEEMQQFDSKDVEKKLLQSLDAFFKTIRQDSYLNPPADSKAVDTITAISTSSSWMQRMMSYQPLATTFSLTADEDDNEPIGYQQAMNAYESLFGRESLAIMVKLMADILADLQDQSFGKYFQNVVYTLITSKKHHAIDKETLNITVAQKKLHQVVKIKQFTSRDLLEQQVSLLTNCLLFQDHGQLHQILIKSIHKLAQVDSGLVDLVSEKIPKLVIIDTKAQLSLSSATNILDLERLFEHLMMSLRKYAEDYLATVPLNVISLPMLRYKSHILCQVIDQLRLALCANLVATRDENDYAMTGALTSTRSSFVLSTRSSFGIELQQLDKAQLSTDYSFTYEVEFMSSQAYPIILHPETMALVVSALTIIENGFRIALDKCSQVTMSQSSPSAASGRASTRRQSRTMLPESSSTRVRSHSFTSGSTAHPGSVSADALPHFTAFASHCQLLTTISRSSRQSCRLQFDRVKDLIYSYLSIVQTLSFEVLNQYPAYKVWDFLAVYGDYLDFEDSLETLFTQHAEKVMNRLLSWSENMMSMEEEESSSTSQATMNEIRYIASFYRLVAAILTTNPLDFEAIRKPYETLSSAMTVRIPEAILTSIVSNSDSASEVSRAYADLCAAMIKVYVNLHLFSDSKNGNNSLLRLTSQDVCSQVLTSSPNAAPLPLKAQMVVAAAVLHDADLNIHEKSILRELDAIERHLQNAGNQQHALGRQLYPFYHLSDLQRVGYHCIYSCRDFMLQGAIKALLCRAMAINKYPSIPIQSLWMELLKSAIADAHLSANEIQVNLSCYLFSVTQHLAHVPAQASGVHVIQLQPEFYSCVRKVIHLYIRHRHQLRLEENGLVEVGDFGEIIVYLLHLYIITRYQLSISGTNTHARAVLDEIGQLVQPHILLKIAGIFSNRPDSFKALNRHESSSQIRKITIEYSQVKNHRSDSIAPDTAPNVSQVTEAADNNPLTVDHPDSDNESDSHADLDDESPDISPDEEMKELPVAIASISPTTLSSSSSCESLSYLQRSVTFKVLYALLSSSTAYALTQTGSQSLSAQYAEGNYFAKWLCGGRRIIQQLIKYLTIRADDRDITTAAFMFCFISFLRDNVDQLRSHSRVSVQQLNESVANEIERIHHLQALLVQCEVTTLIADKIINHQSVVRTSLSSAVSVAAPSASSLEMLHNTALRLATAVMSWGNHKSQDAIIQSFAQPPIDVPLHLRAKGGIKRGNNAVIALQTILQIVNSNIEELVATQQLPELIHLLPEAQHLFTFGASLCAGFYEPGKIFLLGRSNIPGAEANLLQSLVQVFISLISIANSLIHYIDAEPFVSTLAPKIWMTSAAKRRYVSWHHPKNNFPLLIELLRTISKGFDMLVKCHGLMTQPIISTISVFCPDLLEFLGLLHLRQTSPGFSSSIVRNLIEGQVATWNGGNPLHFYAIYLRELKALHQLDDQADMDILIKLSKYTNQSSRKQEAIITELFGHNHRELLEVSYHCQCNCLRLLTSFTENNPDLAFLQSMTRQFNPLILMQNMESYYQQAKKQYHFQIATVLYLTFLSDLANADPMIEDLVEDWQRNLATKPLHKARVASIECIAANGSIQRVYFPIPINVRKYWGYPEVQKVKEDTLLTVDRSSPEEKIDDFRNRGDGIELVMTRQQRLKLLLGPLHVFIGGKAWISLGALQQLLPSQRVLFVAVTLFFNVYFVYVRSTHPSYQFPEGSDESSRKFRDGIHDYFIFVLQYFHLVLAGLLFLRAVLNSRAADSICPMLFSSPRGSSAEAIEAGEEEEEAEEETVASRGKNILLYNPITFILDHALTNFIRLAVLLYASTWEIAMFFFSFLGFTSSVWFYALCLLDVVYLFDLLTFLVVAMQRNAFRISFTVLMAIIFLYFYAIIDFQFFQDQYNLGGHYGCDTMLACLKLHIDYGLQSSPDWDGKGFIQAEAVSPSGDKYLDYSIYTIAASRVIGTVINISFVVLVNLVLQALISGLIIDTFSSMRQENEDIQKDIMSTCFICSIPKDDFEKNGLNFRKHVREEHNMWKYLWFKIYLENKDQLSYSAIENHAYEMMKSDSGYARLVPIKKSLSLHRAEIKKSSSA
jgi:hypothetical protein